MKGKLGDRQRLLHILDAIKEIESYTADATAESFCENSMMRFASIKQIEIIGEAANLIAEETRNKSTAVPWRQIIGLRHILVHEYFGIDSDLVWQIIEQDLPQLNLAVTELLSEID